MDYGVFKESLKDNGLTLKAFSELSGVKYKTCSMWGKNSNPVDDWVESWLAMYVENREYMMLKRFLKDIVCKDQESVK